MISEALDTTKPNVAEELVNKGHKPDKIIKMLDWMDAVTTLSIHFGLDGREFLDALNTFKDRVEYTAATLQQVSSSESVH